MPSYEVEVIPGLEELVEGELHRVIPAAAVRGQPREGRISLRFNGSLAEFRRLRTAVAVHLVENFDVPRPRALLGHEHLTRIMAAIGSIRKSSEVGPSSSGGGLPEPFETVRISAAGGDSAVFERLRAEITQATGLRPTAAGEDGHLLMSVRPAPAPVNGWQVLARLTPRPLSARRWRVCNLPGALNATVASAMVRLTEPTSEDRFLNLACGSATLLIERHAVSIPRLAVGCDINAEALACAEQNLVASELTERVHLLQVDAARLPFANGAFDALAVDLPYGMLTGAPDQARDLYSPLLTEAARVATPTARLVAITARKPWLDAALEGLAPAWGIERIIPIKVPYRSGGFVAHIYVLRRWPD